MALVEPCVEAVHAANPDLVVISGDLTQRARSAQFLEARTFLDRLPSPQIVIPGNHDVPLYDVYKRFARPFTKYMRYISEDLEPSFTDDEIAVVSLNTAYGYTFIGAGRIAKNSVLRACATLRSLPESLLKIVVTHHPFDLPPLVKENQLVRGAVPAMAELSRSGADIFLAGHLHVVHTELTTRRYKTPGWNGLIVQAATGLSDRRRSGENNAFNVLRTTSSDVVVETMQWFPERQRFDVAHTEQFQCRDKGWQRVA